jgi:hypothetical protein
VGGVSFPNSRSPFTSKLKSKMRWSPQSQEHWQYLKNVGHPIHVERYYEAAKQFCNVKFLLLHRNFIDVVWSHRTWDTGVQGHSKVLEMFAKYIEQSLQSLPRDAWKRIDYEDFWSDDREIILEDLCEFLGLRVLNVSSAFKASGFRLSSKRSSRVPCSVVKYLESEENNIFSNLFLYSAPAQHIGYHKSLSTYAENSPKSKRNCMTQ